MNITRPLVTAALLTLAACAQAPAPGDGALPDLAPLTFGTSSPDAAVSLAEHSSGVYAVGYTFGDLHGDNQGERDAFIRKYHSSGDILWGRQFGTPTVDLAEGVASDEDDNAYVVGMTEGSLAGKRGSFDAFLRKYTPSGSVAWTRQFGTSADDIVSDVAAYGSNVYVVGITYGNLAGKIGGSDAFIRKYTSDGRVVWTRQFGASWDDLARDVAVDSSGNAYVVGTTSGMFVRKYTPGGSVAWTRQLAYRDLNDARAVAVSGNSVYLVGAFEAFLTDVRVAKYTTSGVLLWDKTFGSSDRSDEVADASADSSGNLYFAGHKDSLEPDAQGQYHWDGYVQKLKPDGTPAWVKRLATAEYEATWAVLARGSQVYAGGWTLGVLGGVNSGAEDAFLRRLNNTTGDTVWTDQ